MHADPKRRSQPAIGEIAIPEEIVMDRFLHQVGLFLVTAVMVFSYIDSGWLHR